MNVIHVLTITKNLVPVEKMDNQGMEVRFTHLRCFIEEEGCVIVQRRRERRMFILNSTDGSLKDKKSSQTSTYGTSG